jgi:hypothetical protein
MATKRDIQEELDTLGVDYSGSATKAELEALLAELFDEPAAEISDETGTVVSSGIATSFEDVTGICRQCNKPADHLHQGV